MVFIVSLFIRRTFKSLTSKRRHENEPSRGEATFNHTQRYTYARVYGGQEYPKKRPEREIGRQICIINNGRVITPRKYINTQIIVAIFVTVYASLHSPPSECE